MYHLINLQSHKILGKCLGPCRGNPKQTIQIRSSIASLGDQSSRYQNECMHAYDMHLRIIKINAKIYVLTCYNTSPHMHLHVYFSFVAQLTCLQPQCIDINSTRSSTRQLRLNPPRLNQNSLLRPTPNMISFPYKADLKCLSFPAVNVISLTSELVRSQHLCQRYEFPLLPIDEQHQQTPPRPAHCPAVTLRERERHT